MQHQRAQGCLMGQLSGDALGSLVEFQSADEILQGHPGGVCELVPGGTWNTLAGQPTDDSELALSLARVLVDKGTYNADAVLKAYKFWFKSDPFDCGNTTAAALRGTPNGDSQANGALMRVSPLGIFGANYPLEQVAEWAREDAALTHPHAVCQDANALFAMAIAYAVRTGQGPEQLYQTIVNWVDQWNMESSLAGAVHAAAERPPVDYCAMQGWVLIAMQNALWQLVHAPSLEAGVVDMLCAEVTLIPMQPFVVHCSVQYTALMRYRNSG